MSYLLFALFYTFVASVPSLVLLVRRRGWRPMFFCTSFFLTWTGGGWLVMLALAVMERDGTWKNA